MVAGRAVGQGVAVAKTAEERGDDLVIVDGEAVVATLRMVARRRLPNGIRVGRGVHHGVPMAVAWRLDGTLIRAVALDAAERAATAWLQSETNFATALQATESLAVAVLALTAAPDTGADTGTPGCPSATSTPVLPRKRGRHPASARPMGHLP